MKAYEESEKRPQMNSIKDMESGQEILKISSKAEEASGHRFSEMIDEAGEGFYETDTNGNLRGYNDAFCQVLGYAREEIQGRNFTSFMDEGSARRLHEVTNRVRASYGRLRTETAGPELSSCPPIC
jgi:PAS domain-containing protein